MTNDKFLEILYKDLDGNIEVREVPTNKNDKRNRRRYFFNSVEELKEYEPPNNKHVYCGVFSRFGRNGTAASVLTTKALWADYDYKTVEEVKEILKQNKVPKASVLISSGNGVHAYWILDKRVGVEAESIVKAIAIRTGADTAAAERARVMRVPGTFNVKSIPYKQCGIIEHNLIEYNLEEFKEIFSKELYYMKEAMKRSTVGQEIKELKKCSRACIRFMAKGTTQGHRNFALCKITKWLQIRGYTRRAALDVIRRWNTLNTPVKPYQQILVEFNKTWEMDYKFLGCKFKNKKLQEQSNYFCGMGECKYASTQKIEEITAETTSKIDNLIFNEDIYPGIRGMELAIHFTILKSEGITKEHLSDLIGVHKQNKNFVKAINHLNELKLIKVIKGNKRLNEKDILISGNEYNDGRGYTIVNNLLSEAYLGQRITDTEYKLLILLKAYNYSESDLYLTREKIAKIMGKSEKTITRVLNKLKYKLYIKMKYKPLKKGGIKFYIKLQY